jgi:hypothetical protein
MKTRTHFATPCHLGLEGIVSKRLGSAYNSGRSRHWIKSKNSKHPAVRRGSAVRQGLDTPARPTGGYKGEAAQGGGPGAGRGLEGGRARGLEAKNLALLDGLFSTFGRIHTF